MMNEFNSKGLGIAACESAQIGEVHISVTGNSISMYSIKKPRIVFRAPLVERLDNGNNNGG